MLSGPPQAPLEPAPKQGGREFSGISYPQQLASLWAKWALKALPGLLGAGSARRRRVGFTRRVCAHRGRLRSGPY